MHTPRDLKLTCDKVVRTIHDDYRQTLVNSNISNPENKGKGGMEIKNILGGLVGYKFVNIFVFDQNTKNKKKKGTGNKET